MEPPGNLDGDDGQADFIEEGFTMGTITADPSVATNAAPFVQSARIGTLNIEAVTANPALPAGRKWAIRFDAGGTVTLVLGMRDYGRGWFSAYFAGLVATRLGIPFQRIRLFYSANLPAALRTPVPSPVSFRRGDIGPIAGAATDIIESMCNQAIEKGRFAFAAVLGIGIHDVGFDQPAGRFFVLDHARGGNILDLAIPRGSSKSTGPAMKFRQSSRPSISEAIPVPSAA